MLPAVAHVVCFSAAEKPGEDVLADVGAALPASWTLTLVLRHSVPPTVTVPDGVSFLVPHLGPPPRPILTPLLRRVRERTRSLHPRRRGSRLPVDSPVAAATWSRIGRNPRIAGLVRAADAICALDDDAVYSVWRFAESSPEIVATVGLQPAIDELLARQEAS